MSSNNPKLDLYKRTYLYALRVIKFVEKLPKDPASQIIGNQLLRSGTSVAANLIEAKAASSKKDYINFYQHALKSANESNLWIGLLRDVKKAVTIDAESLKETFEIASILASSVLTMKGKRRDNF